MKLHAADVLRRPAPDEGGIILYDLRGRSPRGDEHELLATFPLPDLTHETGVHPHPAFSHDVRRAYFNATEDGGKPYVCYLDLSAHL